MVNGPRFNAIKQNGDNQISAIHLDIGSNIMLKRCLRKVDLIGDTWQRLPWQCEM